MNGKDVNTHQILVAQTGVHKFSKEQLEVMQRIGGLDFELQDGAPNEDPDCTLNLPALQRTK